MLECYKHLLLLCHMFYSIMIINPMKYSQLVNILIETHIHYLQLLLWSFHNTSMIIILMLKIGGITTIIKLTHMKIIYKSGNIHIWNRRLHGYQR